MIQSLRAFRWARQEYFISSRTFLASKCPKGAPTWHQKKQKWGQQPAQMGSSGAKIEPRWCKDGGKTAKKLDKRGNETKKSVAPHSTAPREANMVPTWPQLGSQNRAKMSNTSIPISIICLRPLGIDFRMDFDGFFSRNGTKLVPTWDQTSMFM